MKNKPKIITAVIILSCLLSIFSFAQTTLTGKVLEDKSQTPIPYATVYIDGTSNGTITDENGTFELTDVRPPAKVVVSHLSYLPQVKQVFVRGDLDLNFSLEKRRQEIEPVKVEAENARVENMNDFKRLFLGNDYWGNKSVVLNDSVLFFYKTYDDITVEGTDTTFIRRIVTRFEVQASEPILIDLPALGYTLYVDLITCYQDLKTSYAFSYNYYKPYEGLSRLKSKRVEKKRQKVYYNSIQHFCRALYFSDLDEEGYGLYRKGYDSFLGEISYKKEEIYDHVIQVSDDQMLLVGLKDSAYIIHYFYNSRGEPHDVKTYFSAVPHAKSTIIIKSDSCALSKNGLLPGSDVTFRGTLGRKRMGGMLPKYYELPTQ